MERIHLISYRELCKKDDKRFRKLHITKRFIAALLSLVCVATLCCGCHNDSSSTSTPKKTLTENPKDNEFLPLGLEFGMSSEEAEQVYPDFPDVDYSDYEIFYEIDGQSLYADMMEGNGIVLDPNCSFNLNEDNEIYGFTVKTTIYDGEGAAELLFNEYVDFFQVKSGLTATINESSSKLEANIETETLRLSVILAENDGDFTVSAITCCKVYE